MGKWKPMWNRRWYIRDIKKKIVDEFLQEES
jgi:hypothetical protein